MLCLFVAVKRQELMLQTKDLVLIFDVTLLHWPCTKSFAEEQMWHGENSAGVSCAMDSRANPVESELPCQRAQPAVAGHSVPLGVVCGIGLFLDLKPAEVKLVPCKSRGTLLVMDLRWDEA